MLSFLLYCCLSPTTPFPANQHFQTPSHIRVRACAFSLPLLHTHAHTHLSLSLWPSHFRSLLHSHILWPRPFLPLFQFTRTPLSVYFSDSQLLLQLLHVSRPCSSSYFLSGACQYSNVARVKCLVQRHRSKQVMKRGHVNRIHVHINDVLDYIRSELYTYTCTCVGTHKDIGIYIYRYRDRLGGDNSGFS